jgi:RhtB (resistance to homoserine/threonine) family protein
MLAQLGGFVALATIIVVTPGQDTLLTIRNSLVGGRRAGLCTAGGVATGQVIWAVAASVGVTALIEASRPAFLAIKITGAAYLVYLGLRSLRAAVRPRGATPITRIGDSSRLQPATAFRHGVVSNLSNPKMIAVFVSLLPQFTNSIQNPLPVMLILGLLFSVMTFLWLVGYAIATARIAHHLRRPPIRRLLNGLCGTTLVVLGLRLTAEQP